MTIQVKDEAPEAQRIPVTYYKYVCWTCGVPNNYWRITCRNCEDTSGGDGEDD